MNLKLFLPMLLFDPSILSFISSFFLTSTLKKYPRKAAELSKCYGNFRVRSNEIELCTPSKLPRIQWFYERNINYALQKFCIKPNNITRGRKKLSNDFSFRKLCPSLDKRWWWKPWKTPSWERERRYPYCNLEDNFNPRAHLFSKPMGVTMLRVTWMVVW